MKKPLSNKKATRDVSCGYVAHHFVLMASLLTVFTWSFSLHAFAATKSIKEVLYTHSLSQKFYMKDHVKSGVIENVCRKIDGLLNIIDGVGSFDLTKKEPISLLTTQLIATEAHVHSSNPANEANSDTSLEFTSFNTAIDLALTLHPTTSTLVFIGSEKARHNQHIFNIVTQEIVPSFRKKYDIKIMRDESISTLKTQLNKLPKDTLIFALSNTLAKNENALYSPIESIRILSSISTFPIYSYWPSHIGHGAIGGQIVTKYSHGEKVNDLDLSEITMSQIQRPKGDLSPASLFFDMKMMDKFGIDKEKLPKNTQFIHDTPPPPDNSKINWLVLLMMLCAIIAAAVGFVLFIQRQKQTIARLSCDQKALIKALDINKEALADANQLLKEVNTVDDLTGLFNVRYFDETLDKELRRASRYKAPLSLMLISFDHYQSYLRHYGEDKAEEQLVLMSDILNVICQRSSDIIAYIQDAKFAIILPHTSRENALFVCHKIHDKLREKKVPFILSKTGMITFSIGLSSLEGIDQHINPQHMYNTSEMLRLSAEAKGGNRTKSDCIRLNTEQSLLLKM